MYALSCYTAPRYNGTLIYMWAKFATNDPMTTWEEYLYALPSSHTKTRVCKVWPFPPWTHTSTEKESRECQKCHWIWCIAGCPAWYEPLNDWVISQSVKMCVLIINNDFNSLLWMICIKKDKLTDVPQQQFISILSSHPNHKSHTKINSCT